MDKLPRLRQFFLTHLYRPSSRTHYIQLPGLSVLCQDWDRDLLFVGLTSIKNYPLSTIQGVWPNCQYKSAFSPKPYGIR